MNIRVENTIKALKNNNMEAFYFENSKEALEKLVSLISKDKTTAFGGSVTVNQTGIYQYLKENGYNLLDRFEKGLTREEITEIFKKSFFADYYVTGCNAITENGCLFNVDGNGNRVAAMLFGPEEVFVIAGVNKIVKDLEEAKERVRKTAAPLNTKRLSCETYCKTKGECVAMGKEMGYGCASEQRICADYVLMSRQRNDRIKVFLINEELGY